MYPDVEGTTSQTLIMGVAPKKGFSKKAVLLGDCFYLSFKPLLLVLLSPASPAFFQSFWSPRLDTARIIFQSNLSDGRRWSSSAKLGEEFWWCEENWKKPNLVLPE